MNELTLGEKEILTEIDILTNKCFFLTNLNDNITNKV
jgi:hypothetical protein